MALTSELTSTLPKLASVKDFAAYLGLNHHEGYAALQKIPSNCVIRIGGRIRVNIDALAAWINSGGSL